MNHLDPATGPLAPLRHLPEEVTLERVAQLVAAFPLFTPPTSWAAPIKSNLNLLFMTTLGTLLIGSIAVQFGTATPVPIAPPPEPAATERSGPPATPPPVADTTEAFTPAPPASGNRRTVRQPEPDMPVAAPHDMARNEPEPPPPTATAPPASRDSAPPPAVPIRTAQDGRTFDLRDFTRLRLMCSADVRVEQGPFSVTASGPPAQLERVQASVENGALFITMSKERVAGPKKDLATVIVTVRLPQLEAVEVVGSGDVRMAPLRDTRALKLALQGSGDIELQGLADAEELTISIKGSGDVVCRDAHVSGRTTIDLQGSGDIELHRLAGAEELVISLKGPGDVVCRDVHVKGRTAIELLGSGDVGIDGTTGTIDVVIQGSGDVDTRALTAQGGSVSVMGSGDAYVHSNGPLKLHTQGSGTIHNVGPNDGQRRTDTFEGT